MQLEICPQCKRPFMAEKEFCPHCPEPYTWNQESPMNVGCLLMMTVAPLFLVMLFWLLMFMGMIFH